MVINLQFTPVLNPFVIIVIVTENFWFTFFLLCSEQPRFEGCRSLVRLVIVDVILRRQLYSLVRIVLRALRVVSFPRRYSGQVEERLGPLLDLTLLLIFEINFSTRTALDDSNWKIILKSMWLDRTLPSYLSSSLSKASSVPRGSTESAAL